MITQTATRAQSINIPLGEEIPHTEVSHPSHLSHSVIEPDSSRRLDIDEAILWLLEHGPRTKWCLFNDLRSLCSMPEESLESEMKPRLVSATIDKRTVKRHLGYLIRDGLVSMFTQTKVLIRGCSETTWFVKYYQAVHASDCTPPPGAPLFYIMTPNKALILEDRIEDAEQCALL